MPVMSFYYIPNGHPKFEERPSIRRNVLCYYYSCTFMYQKQYLTMGSKSSLHFI